MASTPNTPRLLSLPPEIFEMAIAYLPFKDLPALPSVSKGMRVCDLSELCAD